MINDVLVPIHPDGWKFIGIAFVVALVLSMISTPLGIAGFVVAAWVVYFFRNPDRVTPTDKGLIISPADGKVVDIKPCEPPKELMLDAGVSYTKISVFLNIFNVHVNKMPYEGTVEKMSYIEGKFFNASLDKASEHNERMAITLATDIGRLGVIQIAGLVARRICTEVEEGQKVIAGEDYGLIRFGSRVDLYVPESFETTVLLGQTTLAGETVMARAPQG